MIGYGYSPFRLGHPLSTEFDCLGPAVLCLINGGIIGVCCQFLYFSLSVSLTPRSRRELLESLRSLGTRCCPAHSAQLPKLRDKHSECECAHVLTELRDFA